MKYLKFKSYNLSTFIKNLNKLGLKFSKIFKYINFDKIRFKINFSYFNLKRYDFHKLYRNLSYKKISFKKYKTLPIYFAFIGIIAFLIFLIVPYFYSYNKSKIEKVICGKKIYKCSIKGNIGYSFYPTPRIKIEDLLIKRVDEKNKLVKAEDVAVTISLDNLFNKKKHIYKKIKIKNFEVNFNIKNLEKYKDIFNENIKILPIYFSKGKIIFYDDIDYVATINEVKSSLKLYPNTIDIKINGKFSNDDLLFKLESKKDIDKIYSELLLKVSKLDLLAKANYTSDKKNNFAKKGNILIRQAKNKITSIFSYKDNKLNINKSNLSNYFMDGALDGEIVFSPYFDFNLNLNLNSINFTKLYSYFLSLDTENKNKLFNINNKINGNLVLSSDKIYSNYGLIKSFESEIIFKNGNILFNQFLINLGKLGAADFIGNISTEKKTTNFKFESNIYVDNQKKFLSKFGIYSKDKLPSNLFVSGNFDINNRRMSFYEISDSEKLKDQEINFIEEEFNEIMLEKNFETLFHFPKFKKFIKTVTEDEN